MFFYNNVIFSLIFTFTYLERINLEYNAYCYNNNSNNFSRAILRVSPTNSRRLGSILRRCFANTDVDLKRGISFRKVNELTFLV